MPAYAASLITRRSGNGHIGALIRQLDEVLYASFVASYILDANFLNFVIRCISQLQFSSPKEHHPERSLKFHITAAFLINFLNCIYHLTVPLIWDPRGITIDFVGQSYLPSKLQLFTVDVTTTFLQLFLIILTYETGHYGSEADLDDSIPVDLVHQEHESEEDEEQLLSGESPSTPEEPLGNDEALSSYSQRTVGERPILDFHLQPTLHRIMHDKPVSIISQEDTASNEDAVGGSAVARLRRLQQARTRSRRRRMGQSTSNGRQSPEGGRLDVESDEEREVGMPAHNNA